MGVTLQTVPPGYKLYVDAMWLQACNYDVANVLYAKLYNSYASMLQSLYLQIYLNPGMSESISISFPTPLILQPGESIQLFSSGDIHTSGGFIGHLVKFS